MNYITLYTSVRVLFLVSSGYSCTLSRLECIQPHFADEFAEQLRRVEHHNKREATRKPLPLFSDQQDDLLISPIEAEVHILYTHVL